MIKLSKKWDYALKAIFYIANIEEELIHIKDISMHQWISESLLRRIIADLEKGRILKTVKGRNGWVQLSRSPSEITIYQILEAIGEDLGITECTIGEFCEHQDTCYTTDVFWDLQRGFNSLLKMYTVEKALKKDSQ